MRHPLPLVCASSALLLTATFHTSAVPAAQEPAAPAPVAHDRTFVPARPDGTTARIVAAAKALQGALGEALAAKLVAPREDEARLAGWSNLPTGIYAREGVRLGDLDEAQRRQVFELLGVVLSARGVEAVRDLMLGDELLPKPPQGIVFGEAEYYLAFIGAPALDAPWTIQFGGHHLAVNATVLGERVVLAPTLTGGQPMRYEHAGRAVAQMAVELEHAYALVASLTDAQRAVAVRSDRPVDLTWGPGRERPEDRAAMPAPEGLAASEMDDTQRAHVRAILAERMALLNDEDAAERMAELDRELPRATFAWFGPTGREEAATYRVQGPSFLVEFAPQGRGAAAAQHVHAIYRDPTNEYGRGLAR